MTHDRPLLAAVLFPRGGAIDTLLATAAARLSADGWRLAGALQAEERDADGCCGPMRLRSLTDGSETVISQNLGKLSAGCRLDPQALLAAAVRLTADLDGAPDLLVLNRFGKAEAEGGGLRPVIEKAVEAGVPTLIAVRDDHAAAWATFHGGLAETMPANDEAILDWCRSVLQPRKAA